MITAAGIGSGIDVESIVTQLMELEREPVTRLEQKRERLDVELSAYGSAKGAMSTLGSSARTLGDAARFGPFVAASGDEAVFTATAAGTAAAEGHDIEVLALASAHRIATGPYAASDASVGAGEWSFASGDSAFTVTLGAGDDSLRTLRDAINDSPDNDAVVASLLTTDDGVRLVVAARETGAANAITTNRAVANGSLFGGTTNSNPFSEVVPASDARLIVDGFEVTSASNSVAGVIEGVVLELTGIGGARLDTSRDTEALKTVLDEFVANYNALVTELGSLADGPLQSDRLPRNAETGLRAAFATDLELADGSTLSPLELGFTFDRYGTLSVDSARLAGAQENGLEDFIDAFSRGEDGFGARVDELLSRFTAAGGRIDVREDGVDARRAQLDKQIEGYEYRLERTETRFRRQFTAMDRVVSELQSTSGFLADRLAGYAP